MMKHTAAIWPLWLALLVTSGLTVAADVGSKVTVKSRRSTPVSGLSNQMYVPGRSNSRYKPLDYETGESTQTNTYDTPTNEPYRFSYMVDDRSSNMQFRSEQREPDGVVRGSYGFRDASGVYRLVEYMADATGFHAKIHTNEPGVRVASTSGLVGQARSAQSPKIRDRNPANVQMSFDQPPDMNEFFGRRQLPAYSYTNDVLDQYRAAATHLQSSGSQSGSANEYDFNRKSTVASPNIVQNKPEVVRSQVIQVNDNGNKFENEFAVRTVPVPKRRTTVLKRVLRPIQSQSISNTDGSTKSFNLAKFHTRPSIDTIDDSTIDVRPVFKPIESESSGRNIPDASITKPQKFDQSGPIRSTTESTLNGGPSSSSTATLDLQEFSQKYPEKWQRILVAKQPELNVFGEKMGWSNDRLHRLESEQGVFGHKLHRLVNEPNDVSSSLTGRSMNAEVKKNHRGSASSSSSSSSSHSSAAKSTSTYVPPISQFGPIRTEKADVMYASASTAQEIDPKPTKKYGDLGKTTLAPNTVVSDKPETVTMVSVSSSVSMSSSKSSKLSPSSPSASSSPSSSSSSASSSSSSSSSSLFESNTVPSQTLTLNQSTKTVATTTASTPAPSSTSAKISASGAEILKANATTSKGESGAITEASTIAKVIKQ